MHDPDEDPDDMVSIPTTELERYKHIERRYNELCKNLGLKEIFNKIGDLTIEEVFTKEQLKRLGFKAHKMHAIRNLCLTWSWQGVEKPILTLRQLACVPREHILYQRNCGEKSVQIIEAVLAEYGLRLGSYQVEQQ